MNNILYLVVPCYNEEECLVDSSVVLKEKLNQLINEKLIDEKSRILFVNDGSKDKTWEVIDKLHSEDKIFQGLCLSRNKGHQNACLAGLDYAKDYADMLITIDADLQDDPNTIKNMVQKYLDGNEVVYGVRSKRKKDSFFKRFTAESYYKLLQKMGVDIIYNHADYRLMSKRVVTELLKFPEVNLFLRGMVPQIGFKSDIVTYERLERTKGESKYPLKKMLALAWNGITSFSVKPLKLITSFGIFLTIVSILCFITFTILFLTKVLNYEFGSYIIMTIGLATGILLIAMGVLGEYVGKTLQEVKARPRYFISKVLNDEDK
ncbi:MAG: glycosyltransferase family 2 protein [Acholeplasmatales bacterium]|nr:glycosyltransferase family 2 protein [Acholeplasmatales bacterium]